MWLRHQTGLTAEFFKTNIIFFAFFLLIFAALFLGDGKQAAADTFFAGVILSLWIVALYQKQKIRPIPATTQFLWVVVFAAYAVSTLFSDSVGYSISSAARLCMGYLTYRLFYSLSSPKTLHVFAVGVVVFVGFAALVATVFMVFPHLAGGLPLMNLLYANYGHNHLADLLVFVAPLILYWYKDNPSPKTIIALAAFVTALGFTFARGAWILIAGYFLFESLRRGHTKVPRKAPLLASVLLFGLSAAFLVVSIVPSEQKQKPYWFGRGDLGRQVIKSSPINEGRFRYWQQAISAIKERPILGSGPGTFYLESKRLQDAPLSYSWFAHSFPLEALVELGALGAIPLFLLLFYHGKEIIHEIKTEGGGRGDRYATPLAIGAGLTLVYGTYEFNLDFLVVWLLFWATLGVLLGAVVKTGARHEAGRSWTVPICLFIVGSYYCSFAAGLIFSKKAEPAFLIAPYDTDRALRLLDEKTKDKSSPTKTETFFLRAFHKNNPEVMYGLASASTSNLAHPIYERTLVYDPQNIKYAGGLIERLLEEKNTTAIGALVEKLGESILPEKSKETAKQISFMSPTMTTLYAPSLFEDVGSTGSRAEYLAKMYYFLGLAAFEKDARLTEKLWILARDTAPTWGYFHMELAALEYRHFRDALLAAQVLMQCETFEYAKTWCASTPVDKVPQIGSSRTNIKEIPNLIQ